MRRSDEAEQRTCGKLKSMSLRGVTVIVGNLVFV